MIWLKKVVEGDANTVTRISIKILIPTERLYHFDHLLQVLKKSLSTLILYIPVFLNYFIHVYSPEAKADKPLGSNFDVNRKALSFWPFVASFIKNHFEVWFYTYFLMFSCMYIAPGQEQTTPWWQSFDVNRKPRSLWPFVVSFKIILYMYIAPGQGQTNPWGQILMSTESSYHFDHLLQVSKKSLWILILYTFFNVFPHVYNPGAGADNPLWTKFWCQQKGLVTLPICCKFQKNIFEIWLYTYFCLFLYT